MEILSLGEKIKRKRKEMGMTLKDLAGDRITPGQISLVESSKSNPSMDLLEYLAGKLNTSVEYLMETEETQAQKICLYYENIAESYIVNGNLILGEQNIEKGLYYAEKYNLEYRKAKILYLRAYIHMLKEEDVLAQQFFLSANVIFIKNNCYEEVVKTFLKLGRITIKLKAYHSAGSYFQQAEKVYMDNNIGNDFLIGEIYYYIAATHLKLDNHEKAINYTYLAKEKFEQIDDKEQYAKTLLLLCEEFEKNGNIENAIRYSKKTLDVFRKIDNAVYISQIENNMGKLFSEFDNMEESFMHLNKAKEIREKNNDNKLIETLIDICENFIKTKDIERAKQILDEIYDKIQNQSINFSNKKDLIKYYLIKYKVDKMESNMVEAENSLVVALDTAKEMEFEKQAGEICVILGKFYIDIGLEEKASIYLSEGVEFFKDLGIIKDF
ncbi:helix-turn-helix domain-containing protein [Haloimpatiens sp. FM7330]|uniref:helix-turn-helix domain-containing protein n=1 Tax=Haloimpatiens sp. FM7330 TaxID=3298610 RepID=UPI003626227F